MFGCFEPRRSVALLALVGVAALTAPAWGQPLELPNPLARADGSLITTAEEWRAEQRPKVLELFEDHVYGHATVGRPAGMSFEVVEEDAQAMAGAATLKRIEITLPNAANSASLTLRVVLFLPNAVKGPAPTFLLINNRH